MLTAIENLSHSDLKSRRAELVAEAAEASPDELASRYVQARTDAKARDERMARMGQEILALTAERDTLRLACEKAGSDNSSLKAGIAEANTARDQAMLDRDAHRQAVQEITAKLIAAEARITTLQSA